MWCKSKHDIQIYILDFTFMAISNTDYDSPQQVEIMSETIYKCADEMDQFVT